MRAAEKKRFGVKSSLRLRYTLTIVGIVLISLSLLGGLLTFSMGRYWYHRSLRILSENCDNVAASASDLYSYGYISTFVSSTNSNAMLCSTLSLISDSIDADVFICDTAGDSLMCRHLVVNGSIVPDGYCRYHSELKLPEGVIASAIDGRYEGIEQIDGIKEKMIVVCMPVKAWGQTVAVVAAITPAYSYFNGYLRPFIRLFLLCTLIAVVIGVVAGYTLAGSLIKPLKRLSDATGAFASGKFDTRLEENRNDEIGRLAEDFNAMADSLGRLESSRSSFIANVSHELKTPMTTIGGFIDGILDGTIPPEKERGYLETVSAEVKRLSRIVVAMLNLSKIEAGQLDLNPVRIDLGDMLLSALLLFERRIEKNGVEVRGLDTFGKHYVLADADLFGQVIYNLVDNAVKFTPENGYIELAAREDDDFCVFSVTNSGKGIREDELSRIFERFYKVDKSRSYDKKSTGLGLYIAKSILSINGGSIGAESEVGEYTRFIVKIPKAV